jgi:hypothetical protein
MGEISDLSYQTLHTAANNFIRLETLREANNHVSNAISKLLIFRHYDIDDAVHSSSVGQKIETQFSTIRSRYSPKYFGLKKGISHYTLVTNHGGIQWRWGGEYVLMDKLSGLTIAYSDFTNDVGLFVGLVKNTQHGNDECRAFLAGQAKLCLGGH